MTKALLIRHGQASFGAENYDQLSDLGVQQARWLGSYLQSHNAAPERLFAGTLKRQQQTATAMCEAFSEPPELITDASLNEFEFDVVCKAYMQKHDLVLPSDAPPKAFYRVLKMAMTSWQRGELNGLVTEPWEAFIERADNVLALLRQYAGCSQIAAVSSGGIIAAVVSQILGCAGDATVQLNLQIKNTSVSELFVSDNTVRLHSFNHVPHLDNPDRHNSITFS